MDGSNAGLQSALVPLALAASLFYAVFLGVTVLAITAARCAVALFFSIPSVVVQRGTSRSQPNIYPRAGRKGPPLFKSIRCPPGNKVLIYILDLYGEENANIFDLEDFRQTARLHPDCKGFHATTYRGAIEAFNRLTGGKSYLPARRGAESRPAHRSTEAECGVPAIILRGTQRLSVVDVDERLEDGDIIVLLQRFC